MGDLDDQLRRLAEQRAARTPVTTSADVRTAEPQRPSRFPVLLAAVATFAVLAGLAIWLAGQNDENGTDVAGSTTTSPPPASTTAPPPDPTTPAPVDRPDPVRAEIDAVDPAVAYDLVVGTDVGIELRRTFTDDVDVLVGPATELAFLVDGWLISQDESQGPVRAGRTTFPNELDLGEGETRLLDAAIVDGAASALVTRRTGTTPENTTERLLLVGVEDRSVTDLGVVGGWESGLDDGRFADGAIALLKSAEGFTWIAALDYSGTELWATPETFDATLRMTVSSDTVLALNPSWAADGAAPIFPIRRFELRSGELMETVSTRLTPVDGVALDEVYCRRLVMWPAPSCGQSSGPPVQIDFYTRTIAPLLGPVSAGTPTAVDATVSTTFPPSAPREVPD